MSVHLLQRQEENRASLVHTLHELSDGHQEIIFQSLQHQLAGYLFASFLNVSLGQMFAAGISLTVVNLAFSTAGCFLNYSHGV